MAKSKTYIVEFTSQELAVIAVAMDHIGGDPKLSPRKYADSVGSKIDKLIKGDVFIKNDPYYTRFTSLVDRKQQSSFYFKNF